MDIEEISEIASFSFDKGYKYQLLNERSYEFTHKHHAQCEAYHRTMNAYGLDINDLPDYEQLPSLSVCLFKEFELRSCEKNNIVKTMISSGTTGQQVLHTLLDRETDSAQQKCLTRTVSHFLGVKRVPMLIPDSSAAVKSRNMSSARGTGILDFSTFDNKRQYMLNENVELDIEGMKKLPENNKDETIFIFSSTFMIQQYSHKKLLEGGYKPDLSKGVLVHDRGWEKLVMEKITLEEYKRNLDGVCGVLPDNVHDYHGMAEQTGCIYTECGCGHLRASVFSNVLVRRPFGFSLVETREKGLTGVVSVLPESYPGYAPLTGDRERILDEDDCPCGLKGKYFEMEGRIKNMGLCGYNDAYATKF